MDLTALPSINATLNGIASLLLIAGRILIRSKRIDAHRRVMISAFSVSTLFLALYVLHKASRGFESLSSLDRQPSIPLKELCGLYWFCFQEFGIALIIFHG